MANIEFFVIFAAKSIIDAMKIIGRNAEISELERLRDSGRSEFVMVYGRRRVGKTFLIREFFHNEFAFQVTK